MSPLQRGVSTLRQKLGGADGTLLKQLDKLKAGDQAGYYFELPPDYLNVTRRLKINFPKDFPRTLPRLSISPDPGLSWPHVTNGVMCLFGSSGNPSGATPEQCVQIALQQFNHHFCNFVSLEANPIDRKNEFEREITTYWNNQLDSSGVQILLLNLPLSAGALLALSDTRHRADGCIVSTWLADNRKTLETFSKRLSSRSRSIRAAAEAGFVLPLTSIPAVQIPSPADWIKWLAPHATPTDIVLLNKWDKESCSLGVRWIVLKLPEEIAAGYYCLTLTSESVARPDRLEYGSRAARRNQKQLKNVGVKALRRGMLQPLMYDVVHSRNLIEKDSSLSQRTVALVGVGTLGSSIAVQLARSGVGKLILIDPDKFNAENLGRHVLGIDDLGRNKAEALKSRIQNDIPTCDLISEQCPIANILSNRSHIFHKVDLVIVTTADWDSEVLLWNETESSVSWQLLQAWSEPHGLVGHALLSPMQSSDARRLFSVEGNFKHNYSEWENQGVVELPNCGQSFIPAGPVVLNSISTMISQLAIESITHRFDSTIWRTLVNSPDAIEQAGGRYTGPEIPKGSCQITFTRPWPNIE